MSPGNLVKYTDSSGQHLGVILGQDFWHDQGGAYEMWEILSGVGRVVWLPGDALEVISE
jgi:hypothetical protein